ncbi:MAG: cytochrome c1 [Candidatus Tokpelaia sp.]|nr:MAG: cytochrome c1 [Candidatus Tokpelaia sp.]KAA6206539.1 MAG: cytochrome c1 [Candidatus Tokpelaia sp.]
MGRIHSAAKRFLVGTVLRQGCRRCLLLLVWAWLSAFIVTAARAEIYSPLVPPRQNWSFSGIFGIYDKAQLQRGLKVFTETCHSCHSLNYVAFRDLQALGYSKPEIKEFAARFRYKSLNYRGEEVERPGTAQDYFLPPYANAAQAAFANNGAAPPDLSLIARARSVSRPFGFITDVVTHYDTGGADYIYALLTGYQNPPPNITIAEGQYYNPYFMAGNSLAMPPLLQDGLIAYNDGTKQTAAQYAKDVTAFLSWAADPQREKREKTGFAIGVFLLVLAALLYGLKQEIWAKAPKSQTGRKKQPEE